MVCILYYKECVSFDYSPSFYSDYASFLHISQIKKWLLSMGKCIQRFVIIFPTFYRIYLYYKIFRTVANTRQEVSTI